MLACDKKLALCEKIFYSTSGLHFACVQLLQFVKK